jgi:hypothetical protein
MRLVAAVAALACTFGAAIAAIIPPAGAAQWTAVTGEYLRSETIEAMSFSQDDGDDDVIRLDSTGRYLVIHGLDDHLAAMPESAVDRLTISNASVAGDDLWITAGATVTVSRGKASRARRAVPSGIRSLLVVLVVDGNGALPQRITDAADMSDRVFGTSGSTFTAKSQYTACSNGSLTLVPATGTNVVGGVIRVVVNTDVSAATLQATVNAVIPVVDTALGDVDSGQTYDLVMIVQPGTAFAATAYVGGTFSRYRGTTTTHVSTHMHEMGHNFGLKHSNEHPTEYADTTGAMGFATAMSTDSNRGPHRENHPLHPHPRLPPSLAV